MDFTTDIPAVTGAARGLGRHLVDALLERGAPTVYALARDPAKVRRDPRVAPSRSTSPTSTASARPPPAAPT
jgi:NAD(P)-dependent dehydrogenase (short-subunit alcohol dehydrogenase family)